MAFSPGFLAFPATGIRGSAVVAITSDKEVITGKHFYMHRKFSSFFLVVECQYASSPLTHNCLQALETLPSFNVSLRSQYTS